MPDWKEYERGRQNPYELPGSGPINWDFQQGQMDELKRIQDSLNPPRRGDSNAPATGVPAYNGPVYRPYKSMVAAAALPILFGPLGLFYASPKGAVIVIAALFAIPMATGSLDNPAVIVPLLQGSYVVSIVWSLVAIRAYNKAAANNALFRR